jgi:hypothetical protein
MSSETIQVILVCAGGVIILLSSVIVILIRGLLKMLKLFEDREQR